MYPRTNYEMTQADCDALLASMKPVAAMMIGGTTGPSQQENANNAWAALGKKMGFDHMTVQPIHGKGMLHFSAVPSENETQRAERLAKEAEAKKQQEIATLEAEISERVKRLAALTDGGSV